MNKDTFIRELREALAGEMAADQAEAHLRYYEHYIMEEMQKGRSQEEVLARLGDPRLIAKTLVDTGAKAQEPWEEVSPKQRPQKTRLWGLDLSTWYGKLILILGAFAILALVLTILSALLPFLLILLAVSIIIRYFSRRT